MSNQQILIINLIAYIGLFSYYQYRKRIFDLGSVMLLTWTLCAGGACWYYTFPIVKIMYPVLILGPLIYILVCNIYLFLPFLKTDYKRINYVEVYNLKPILYILSVAFAICAIPPFINLIFKLSSISFGGKFLGNMYDSGEDNANLIFHPAIKPFFTISRHFIQFIFFLFFYNLTFENKNRYIILGLSLNIITFFIFSILSGSRGGVVNLLLNFAFYIFLMKNMFSKNIFKTIKRFGYIGLILLFLGVGAITMSRLSVANTQKTGKARTQVDLWLAQYVGESFIQFDYSIWNIEQPLRGEHNFPVIMGLYDPVAKDTPKYNAYQRSIAKKPTYVFYTYIGDIYLDFGFFGGLIVVFLLGLIIKYLLRIRMNSISFYKLIILNFIFVIITMGITANVYRSYYNQMEMVYVGFLLIILNLISKFVVKAPKISSN
ncbi:MAG: oligosaccharide repeat unit polymerase [Muribaculaceae bacterium]|nr:oligosaccharide repeat unit polymerase [Muribaculaceae bacterium]